MASNSITSSAPWWKFAAIAGGLCLILVLRSFDIGGGSSRPSIGGDGANVGKGTQGHHARRIVRSGSTDRHRTEIGAVTEVRTSGLDHNHGPKGALTKKHVEDAADVHFSEQELDDEDSAERQLEADSSSFGARESHEDRGSGDHADANMNSLVRSLCHRISDRDFDDHKSRAAVKSDHRGQSVHVSSSPASKESWSLVGIVESREREMAPDDGADMTSSKAWVEVSSTVDQPDPAPIRPSRETRIPTEIGAYTQHEKLGEGSFGVVYRAEFSYGRSQRYEVALKKFTKDGNLMRIATSNEIRALKSIAPHKCIIELFGIVEEPVVQIDKEEAAGFKTVVLVIPFYRRGSLRNYIKKQKSLIPLPVVKNSMASLLQALEHIHITSKTVHRDVNPANLLIDDSGRYLILTDFGLSVPIKDGKLEIDEEEFDCSVGTLGYRSMEWACLGRTRQISIDSFSAGMVFYRILTREPFVQIPGKVEDRRYLTAIFLDALLLDEQRVWPKFLDNFPRSKAVKRYTLRHWKTVALPSPQDQFFQLKRLQRDFGFEALDLFYALVHPDPSKRITPSHALKHKFFDDRGGELSPHAGYLSKFFQAAQ